MTKKTRKYSSAIVALLLANSLVGQQAFLTKSDQLGAFQYFISRWEQQKATSSTAITNHEVLKLQISISEEDSKVIDRLVSIFLKTLNSLRDESKGIPADFRTSENARLRSQYENILVEFGDLLFKEVSAPAAQRLRNHLFPSIQTGPKR